MRRPDPAQREDGRCARHGCKKRLPKLGVKDGDPFCSNECCRRYHGFPMPSYSNGIERRRRAAV